MNILSQQYTKINNIEELKNAIDKENYEFFISLAGGMLRSSKTITITEKGKFEILNEIDSTIEILTEKQLWTKSNIGKALDSGAFYQLSM